MCAAHGGIPLAYPLYGEELVEIIGGVVSWWCARGGYALAPVGQLTARIARLCDHSPSWPTHVLKLEGLHNGHPLWQTLRYTGRQRTAVDRTRIVQAPALPGT